MAGTVVASTINNDTGLFSTNNAYLGIAKAWVSYNGTTQTINSSFNVSSVTYVSTGNYTVNYTTSMPNATYSAVATCNFQVDVGLPANTKTFATGSIQVSAYRPYPYNAYVDVGTMCVAVFSS